MKISPHLFSGISILLLLLSSEVSQAQVREPFDELNLDPITSHFFYPQTFQSNNIPDGTSFEDVLSCDNAGKLFYDFNRACLDPDLYISEFMEYRTQLLEEAQMQNCVPISIMDITYHDFIPEALSSGLIVIENEKFHDAPNQWMSPYEVKTALIPWILSDNATTGLIRFLLKEEWFITNRNSMPLSVQIDFDNGLGFQTITFGQPIEVTYDDNSERNIQVKIVRNDSTLKAGFHLKDTYLFLPCNTTEFPFPTPAPWNTDPSNVSDYMISANFENEVISGSAYTLNSDDGVFDKPFIFVEGIDFGYEGMLPLPQMSYRNGTFGWCEFSSGFMDPNPSDQHRYSYEMLHMMPEMLEQIREYGYDIVLLDFTDGACDMRKNAELLKHLIRLCNEYKSGSEPLVLAGASMGGQITRYALRDMELQGEDHCTRLSISFDSPHDGAIIPLSLQEAIEFAAEHGSFTASNMIDNMLLRKASCQLLKYHGITENPFHEEWYSLLENMGYPEKCRNVAVANGSGNGLEQEHTEFPLMDWTCDLFGQEVAKFYLCPAGGDGTLIVARMTKAAASADADVSWLTLLQPGLVSAVISIMEVDQKVIYANANTPDWEYAPGGYNQSIITFAEAIDDEAPESCPATAGTYNDKFCFIPAISALGLNGVDPFVSVLDYLEDNPHVLPFDDFYIPDTDENQAHVQVSPENSEFMLNNILGPDRSGLGSELTAAMPNNGNFNYGRPEFTWLRSINVHSGGKLYFNKYDLTHFASESDYVQQKVLFEVVTNDCAPAEVLVHHDGEINLGDEEFNRSADVILNRDSKMTIGAGGVLRIFHGSRLIINEGAELTIHPDAEVYVDDGSIVVNPGGKVTILPGENHITLLNEDAVFDLHGGQLVLEENAHFGVDHFQGPSGYFNVSYGTSDMIVNSLGSSFTLIGDDEYDVMLKIDDHARFGNTIWHNGNIHLERCQVEFGEASMISTDMMFSTKFVRFIAQDPMPSSGDVCKVQVWGNQSDIQGCYFDEVRFKNHEGICKVLNTTFHEQQSGFESYGGSYSVRYCDFDDCRIESESLSAVSSVTGSNFSGQNSAIKEFSLVELLVSKSSFDDCHYFGAIDKRGGKLSVFCSNFNTQKGIFVKDGYLNLSATDKAGYNNFSNNGVCVTLDNASGINLFKGYNNFMTGHQYYVQGTLNIPCLKSEGCMNEVDAYHNFWGHYNPNDPQPAGNNLMPPSEEDFSVTTSDFVSCIWLELPNPCPVLFYDAEPVETTTCPGKTKLEVKSTLVETNDAIIEDQKLVAEFNPNGIARDFSLHDDTPLINSVNFENTPLDSALIFAAMQMESYDSLANDMFAVELFHEILMDNLNQSNDEVKRKMNWGRMNMKSALENLFVTSELTTAQNQTSFQEPVQQYVDVLNVMTSTNLTDSTYQAQFYLELDKGQLFRTIGKPEVTQQVFAHLDDCDLDSLEQSVLNQWREQVEIEVQKIHEYYALDIPVDSLSGDVDTTNYATPVTIQVSDLYFGLWIHSPEDVTFVACGDDPNYRSLSETEKHITVYPNPAHELISVAGIGEGEKYTIQLFDLSGKVVLQSSPNIAPSGTIPVIIPEYVASGSYTLKVRTENFTSNHKVVLH